jgi:hypothetical protein
LILGRVTGGVLKIAKTQKPIDERGEIAGLG